MKKFILIGFLSVLFTSCMTVKTPNYGRLTIGMSMYQVENLLGPPERVLSLTRTSHGYEEVWQYRTAYNEVFALEFINEILEGYQFLYEDYQYAPSYYYRPPHGRPIFPNYSPNKPIIPSQPSRPGTNGRPPSNTQHPDYRPPRPESTSPRPGDNSNTNNGGRGTSTRSSSRDDSNTNSSTTTRSSSSGTSTRGTTSGGRN